MRSIQARLSVGLVAVLVIVGLLTAQVALWLFEQGLQRYLESGLRSETENLLIALQRGPDGLKLNQERLLPAYDRPLSGRYFKIDSGGQTLRSRSLWDDDLPTPDHPGLHNQLVNGPDHQWLLLLRVDYRRLGQPVAIIVAQDYSPIRRSFSHMRQLGLGIGALAILAILLLQRYIVKRALGPLERARRQIAQLRDGQRRELDPGGAAEVEPLIEQINHLLAHTEDSLKRARHAIGNLGHALKTPLAVLLNLSDSGRLAAPDARARVNEQLEIIQQRLGRELNRARLAGDAVPGARFDCGQELPGLMQTLAVIHGEHLDLQVEAPPGLVLARDREDVLELLGNLLDNACKWADATVRLNLTGVAGSFRIEVEDDGPGIEPARRQQVLERGRRLDEAVQGHGLGLGIVRDIVEAWGGELRLETSRWGGLQVVVEVQRR